LENKGLHIITKAILSKKSKTGVITVPKFNYTTEPQQLKTAWGRDSKMVARGRKQKAHLLQ
jgi:hypothetical protein